MAQDHDTALQNPLGLDGFAFCEFTSPDPAAMAAQFEQLGFVAAARVSRARADRSTVRAASHSILNAGAKARRRSFRAAHGPSANGMAFRVDDASAAHKATRSPAVAPPTPTPPTARCPAPSAIEGIGGSLLYLVDTDPFAEWQDGARLAGDRRRRRIMSASICSIISPTM